MIYFFSGQISASLWLFLNPCTSWEISESKGVVGCFDFPAVVAFGYSCFSFLHCTPLASVGGLSLQMYFHRESWDSCSHSKIWVFSEKILCFFHPGSGGKPMSKYQTFSWGFQQSFFERPSINSDSHFAVSFGQAENHIGTALETWEYEKAEMEAEWGTGTESPMKTFPW